MFRLAADLVDRVAATRVVAEANANASHFRVFPLARAVGCAVEELARNLVCERHSLCIFVRKMKRLYVTRNVRTCRY